MPGPDRDSLHDDLARLRNHCDGVVAATLRGAGDEQDEIGFGGGIRECHREQLGVVGDDRLSYGHAAGLRHHRGEHERVCLDDLVHSGLGAERDELVPRGQDRDDRTLADEDGGLPDRPEHGEVGGTEQAAGGEHEIAGSDVLAHLAYVGEGGYLTLDPGAVLHHDVLAPDDGVRAGRHRVARVDGAIGVLAEGHRRAGGGPRGDGDPVHRGRIEGRRGARREDRLCRDPARCELEADRLPPERAQPAGAREGLDPGVIRCLDVLAVERHQQSLGKNGGSGAARVPLRHDDAEAGGATALQYLRRPRPPAAGRGRGR